MSNTALEQALNHPSAQEILAIVVERAYEVFDICGAAEDFCLQTVGGFSVVFGGTNRVVWDPVRGFRIDESNCTSRFKGEWFANTRGNLRWT